MAFSDTDSPLSPLDVAGLRGNHATTAALNRWQTLTLVSRSQCLSQRQLAKFTGLRTSTMSNIIRDLKGLGFIRISGPLPTRRAGPKEDGLEINPDAAWSIGLQLDPRGHEIALVNAAGHLTARRCLPPGMPWQEALAAVPQTVRELTPIAKADPEACAGLGISVAGIVDAARGVVLYSRALGLQDEPLAAAAQKLGVGDVFVERDVNCGLYAEHHGGSARSHQTFLFYLVRVGFADPYQFGLGFLLNGRIFHGLSSASGELDPLMVPKFSSSARTAADYDHFYRDCGAHLASLINLLDVGNIVVASDDPQLTEERLRMLRDQVDRQLLPVPNRKIQISRAELGAGAFLQGAALMAINRHLRARIFKEIQGASLTSRKES